MSDLPKSKSEEVNASWVSGDVHIEAIEESRAEITRLRASSAALKAENEALKAKLSECRCWKDEHCPLHSVGIAAIQAKLSAYEAWQPSDPGTKEAMAVEAASFNWKRANEKSVHSALSALVLSTRAAVVRLEEAGKRDEFHVSQCAALTASLASVTAEREELRLNMGHRYEIVEHERDTARVSLAELRKRMGEAEKLIGQVVADMDADQEGGSCWHEGLREFLASLPSPASEWNYECGYSSGPDWMICSKCGKARAKPAPVDNPAQELRAEFQEHYDDCPVCGPQGDTGKEQTYTLCGEAMDLVFPAQDKPAPVESKPKEEFYCCKDQDNPCHPIRDYCSTGRSRLAADTAKPSPEKP